MMQIKAVETQYKGYRFRSRLEARWAVFFDALGIDWQYEKEGYDLRELGYYLPDFYLTNYDIWVEVKPEEWDRTRDAKKAWTFANQGHTVLWACGVPARESYLIMRADPESPHHNLVQHAWLMPWYLSELLTDWGKEDRKHLTPQIDVPPGTFPDLDDAVVAARSSRFEFGESGAR